MFILYNLVQLVCLILGLPFWIYLLCKKKKYRHRLGERLGLTPPPEQQKNKLSSQNTIIIHSVSVGEVNAALPIIEHLTSETSYHPVQTTTTHTGYQSALKKNPVYAVLYFPLDLLFSVKIFLNMTRPKAIIILETEIWPNLYFEARKRNIPIIVINARISEKSFQGYFRFRFFFKKVFQCVSHFAVQTEKDKEKLLAIGVDNKKISVIGNLKFNSALQKKSEKDKNVLLQLPLWNDFHPVFLAGSTHPGEDEIIIRTWQEVSHQVPGLKLILAPRHIERAPIVADILKRSSLSFMLLSKIKNAKSIPDIILVDTIGDLFYLYPLADAVFIGKSLVFPGGGQNMIEPAVWCKPIFFGPFISHFQHIVDSMLNQKAAIMVKDEEDLKTNLRAMLLSDEKKSLYSRRAMAFVEDNREALDKSKDIILRLLIEH